MLLKVARLQGVIEGGLGCRGCEKVFLLLGWLLLLLDHCLHLLIVGLDDVLWIGQPVDVVCPTYRLGRREGLTHLLDFVVQVLKALCIPNSPPVNVMVLQQVVDVFDCILVSPAV